MSSDKRNRSGSRKYYWMHLKIDFFDQPEIKKLRKLAGGDTYTIIYLKMMLKTVSNDGLIIYQGIEDSFEKEVALIIDEDENNVIMTINYLRAHNLLEEGYSENVYLLNAVKELIGSETMDAQRKRIARSEDSKVIAEIRHEDGLTDNVRHLSADVHICPTEIEQSTEEQEKKIEKEQSKDIQSFDLLSFFIRNDPYNAISEHSEKVSRKMDLKLMLLFCYILSDGF